MFYLFLSLLCLAKAEGSPLNPRSRRYPIHHFGRGAWLYAGFADRLGDWTAPVEAGQLQRKSVCVCVCEVKENVL